jgi:hypothetical protein
MNNENNKKRHCHCAPTLLSGVVFAIIAIMQFLRWILAWDLVVAGHHIPQWPSLILGIVLALLALWNFCRCCCCRCKEGSCAPGTKNG